MSLLVLGSLNLDIVARVAELPKPGETVLGRSVERLPGGKGANQAVAAARAGARVRLVGAVGRDEAGDFMLGEMRAAGVEIGDVDRLADAPTGQAFIWVSDAGENSIVVASGANRLVTPDLIDAEAAALSRVMLAQLETPLAAIEALFAGPGAAAGRLRLLNAAPALAEAARIFELVDILIVNEVELAGFVGRSVAPQAAAALDAAASLVRRPDQVVVVTLGAGGAVAACGGRRLIEPGRPARVVDTTGAGDCFCGVLAARLAEDADLADAMRWANAAAALSVERPGAAPSMPTRAEIEALLGD